MRLLAIEPLLSYEQPDERRIAELTVSLNSTKNLINPIIVDEEQRLLIDGHHRVEAFKWIGMRWIPAFTISYLSDCVQIGRWCRSIKASVDAVHRAFDFLSRGDNIGPWKVRALNLHQTIDECSFEDPYCAAEYVERLSLVLSCQGNSVTIEPCTSRGLLPEQPEFIKIFMDPVVGKDQVLDAAMSQRRYPQQVNRHLVNGRPIGMNIPFDSMKSERTFSSFLVDSFNKECNIRAARGIVYDARFFEEQVILFSNIVQGD